MQAIYSLIAIRMLQKKECKKISSKMKLLKQTLKID